MPAPGIVAFAGFDRFTPEADELIAAATEIVNRLTDVQRFVFPLLVNVDTVKEKEEGTAAGKPAGGVVTVGSEIVEYEFVDEEIIAEVVSKMTGVPLTRLAKEEAQRLLELEEQLRSEYQGQLDEKAKLIDALTQKQAELQETVDSHQATIDKQLETITDLSGKATASQRTEQLNRELTNRSDKLQDEVTELKKRVKAMQKELAEVKEENKALKQFDPPRMKKNLDASKKKLAEKTKANDDLQKSLGKTKTENAELQQRVKELEAKLAELEPSEEVEAEENQAA